MPRDLRSFSLVCFALPLLGAVACADSSGDDGSTTGDSEFATGVATGTATGMLPATTTATATGMATTGPDSTVPGTTGSGTTGDPTTSTGDATGTDSGDTGDDDDGIQLPRDEELTLGVPSCTPYPVFTRHPGIDSAALATQLPTLTIGDDGSSMQFHADGTLELQPSDYPKAGFWFAREGQLGMVELRSMDGDRFVTLRAIESAVVVDDHLRLVTRGDSTLAMARSQDGLDPKSGRFRRSYGMSEGIRLGDLGPDEMRMGYGYIGELSLDGDRFVYQATECAYGADIDDAWSFRLSGDVVDAGDGTETLVRDDNLSGYYPDEVTFRRAGDDVVLLDYGFHREDPDDDEGRH